MVKKGGIGKIFLRRRLDACALSETGKVRSCLVRWSAGCLAWRPSEGRGGPITEWVVVEVCSGMERGVIQAYVD